MDWLQKIQYHKVQLVFAIEYQKWQVSTTGASCAFHIEAHMKRSTEHYNDCFGWSVLVWGGKSTDGLSGYNEIPLKKWPSLQDIYILFDFWVSLNSEGERLSLTQCIWQNMYSIKGFLPLRSDQIVFLMYFLSCVLESNPFFSPYFFQVCGNPDRI